MRIPFLSIAAWCVLVTMAVAHLEAEPSAAATSDRRSVGTAYCGLHCVYGAARQLGSTASFHRILKQKFINGPFGSTQQNLIDAFGEFGLKADYVPSLSFQQLRTLSRPVVLLVRPVGVRTYSHWILFLGVEADGRVRIYDPPEDETSVSVTDLLSVWSGGAVVPESFRDPSVVDSITTGVLSWIPNISLIAGTLCLISLVKKRHPLLGIAFVVIAVTVYVHVGQDTGFAYGRNGTGAVQASFFPVNVPKIDFSEAKNLSLDDQVVFVDARPAGAFERFHLPNSVNIPIDATFGQLVKSVDGLTEAKKVVFYCQSDGCLWADAVASQVANRGIENVVIYRGGVREWRDKQRE